MPGGQRLESVISPEVFEEIKNLTEQLKVSAKLIETFPQINKVYAGADSAEGFRRSTEQLAASNEKAKKTYTNLQLATAQYERVINQVAQSQARLNATQSDAGRQLTSIREQQRQSNLETRNQVVANEAAIGSITQMRAQLALLNREYDNMSRVQRNSVDGLSKKAEIQSLTTDLNKLEQETGRFGRNVGNYSSVLTGYVNTIRGLRGPTKLLGEWLGIGAQEADQFRLLVEHSMQGFVAWLRGKEAKAATTATETAATAANTVAEETNTAATAANTVATEANVAAAEANTVATEAGAVAQTEMAVATTGASTAMKIFRTTMMLSGIGVLVGLVALAIVSMKKYAEETRKAHLEQKVLFDVSEKAAEGYGKEKAALDVLVSSLKSEHTPRKEKLQLIKELQDKYPGYFDSIKTEKDLVDKLPSAYEKAAEGIMLKAKAEAASSLLGENYKKQMEADINFQRKTLENAQRLEDMNKKDIDYGGGASIVAKRIKSNVEMIQGANAAIKAEYEKGTKEIEAESKILLNSIISSNDQITALGGKVADHKYTKEKKEKQPHDDTNEKLKAEMELIKAKRDLSKLELEKDSKRQLEIAEDEKASLDRRLKALSEYTADRNQLVVKDSQAETEEIDLKLQKIAEIEKKSVSKRTNEEKNLLLYKNALLVEKQIAEQKCNDQIEDLARDHQKRLGTIYKQTAETFKKSLVENVEHEKNSAVSKNLDEQAKALEGLMQKYEAGKITLKEFEERKKKLFEGTEVENLGAEKTALQEEMAIFKFFGLNTVELESKLNDVKKRLRDKDFEHFKSTEEKKADLDKKLKEQIRQDEEKTYQLGVALIDGGFERRLNKIQTEIDANTRWKDAEVGRINSSTLSEEQKAAKLTQINATAQARQDQLEQKKRQEQMKQAKFDRDAQALKIAGDAISAHFKLIAELGPAGIPLAIANDVAAALEIGLLMTKPLPKYESGVQSSPATFALTDEAGPELYIKPGGEMFMGSDQGANIKYLEQGTRIIPADEVNQFLNSMMLANTAKHLSISQGNSGNNDAKLDKLNDTLLWQTTELMKATAKQKRTTVVNNHINLGWTDYLKKNIYE